MDKVERDCKRILAAVVGAMEAEYPFQWVENAFTPGTKFAKAYDDFWIAREHLCKRFGIDWEDDDLELIMNGIMNLEEDIGRRMFLYGVKYAKDNCEEIE